MANIIIKTDQSGANDPIYSGQPRIFNFSIGSNHVILRGEFELKKGSSTTESILAEIYNELDGPNGTGDVVASVTVLASSIETLFSTIIFNTNYSASPGNYSFVLSSPTDSGGATNYFIKNGSTLVTDEEGSPIPTPTPTATLTSTPTQTPTPTQTESVACHATSSLVLYYDPSDTNSYPGSGSSVYDLSENELDGTATNVSYTNPYFSFNGTNAQIEITDNNLLEPGSGDWTMEAWFRVTSNQSGVIIGKFDNGGGSEDVSYSIRINAGGNLFAQLGSGVANSYINSTFYQTTTNTWYHVAYVWKNGVTKTLETYINGTSIGSVNHSLVSLLNTPNNLYIGSYNNGEYNQYFNGRIGAIRLYNSALSSSQITQNYNCGTSYFFDSQPTPTPTPTLTSTPTPTPTPTSTSNPTPTQQTKRKKTKHGHNNMTNRANERSGISLSNRLYKIKFHR